MAKWTLLLLSTLLAGVVSCGDFEDGTLNTGTNAVKADPTASAEPIRDGGTNGYHCGPHHDRAAVCHTRCTKQGCVQRTLCVQFKKLQEHLDQGDTLGFCATPDGGV